MKLVIFEVVIVYLVIALIVFCGLKRSDDAKDYIGKTQSTMVKGIFVLLVFASYQWQYSSAYVSADSIFTKLYLLIGAVLGQLIVVPFLFYSGYGIRCRIAATNGQYLASFPRRRILKTWLRTFPILVLFLIVQLFLGKRYSLKSILSSFLFWDSFGNSNWYIFCILIMYIGAYLCFRFIDDSKKSGFSMLVFTAAYMAIMSRFKEPWWYNTAPAFCFGLIFPEIKDQIEHSFKNHKVLGAGILIALLVFLTFFRTGTQIIDAAIYGVKSIVFMMAILYLLMWFSLGNRILLWFGDRVFEVYLLQRLPMIVLSEIGLLNFSVPLWEVLCIIITIALSECFHRFYKWIEERNITSLP